MSKAHEELLLEHIRRHPNGITDEALAAEVPSISHSERAALVNKLSTAKRIALFEKGKSVVYKEITAEEAAKFKGLNAEELLLYQIIKGAGNTGLWTKDMKARTNLPQPHITKVLKTLEGRRLVKSVKNVNNPSRKVYMLAELEPSRDLTGGAWYTENQFDSAFIDVLREAVMGFVGRKGDTTLSEVTEFIAAKKFAKVDLREEDIHSIIQTLIYDGRVDVVEGDDPDDDAEHFRPMLFTAPPTTALTNVPCGVCPVFGDCRDDGPISPATCEYYNKWLEF